MSALSPLDPTSFSRSEIATTTHLALSLDVDFEEHVLRGEASLTFEVLQDCDDLPLDINKLQIESVEMMDGLQLKYTLDEQVANFGSKLTVLLPQYTARGERITVKIKYKTDPSASALTWLEPQQTSGKKYPYLFSQASPISARSILPCQDTPAVKFTYNAEVTAPEEFTVLMGALGCDVINNKSTFCQPVPIPSYLIAIVVGVLECRTVGPRSNVWSEREDLDSCALEFSDAEKYLKAAEKICGPYDWTQYDIVVLPPSFPHAGMENPCLTFISPTIVAGDKSLTSTIIHEIVHSWVGNAVTVKNFEHFWLKEGLTVFLERKISASLNGDSEEAKRYRDFHNLLGLQQLTEGINTLGANNPLTQLVLNLNGVHPSDVFSVIPYEKGSLFFVYLEILFGGPEVFDCFIFSFIRQFSMQSIDTDQFQAFFLDYFTDHDKLENIDWDSWFYESGMPPVIPQYDTTMIDAVVKLVSSIENPRYVLSYDDVQDFNVHQMIHLLQQLIERRPLPIDKLRNLGAAYYVDDSTNKEIMYRWLRLCVMSKDEWKLSEIFTFLNSLGRLKYVRPLYRELYAWEEVRDRAIENFLKNEQYMSHLTAYNLRKDLNLNKD